MLGYEEWKNELSTLVKDEYEKGRGKVYTP